MYFPNDIPLSYAKTTLEAGNSFESKNVCNSFLEKTSSLK
jgi:hypothetical protein